MQDIVVYSYLEKDDAPYQELTDLLHEAFQERLDNNLNFDCAKFTVEQYREETKDGILFVAYMGDTIVGTVFLRLIKIRGLLCGLHEFLAVSSKLKHCGIASCLQCEMVRIAKQRKLVYISSTTALPAKSSVLWHKKNGFVPYRVTYFQGKTYYSYMFMKPIRFVLLLRIMLFFAPFFRSITYYVTKKNNKIK